MDKKTAIVLGCSGQDGSLLAKSLLKKGVKVIGLTRSKQNQIKNHIKLGINKDIEIKEGDINSPTAIKYLLDHYEPDFLFNLAAQSSVGKSFGHPAETLKSIISGTLNILEIARERNYAGKLFFAGSSEMFGDTEKPAEITHEQKPMSPYGIAKQTSYNLVKFYREVYHLSCVTGVLFNHESNLRNDNFVIPKIINSAFNIKNNNFRQRIKFGNINIIRDWGWAPDYVEAMQLITESKKLQDHVVCSGKPHTLKVFIEKVFSKFELNWEDHIEIDQSLFRKQEINISYGSPDLLFKELGWKTKENLSSIINKLTDHLT